MHMTVRFAMMKTADKTRAKTPPDVRRSIHDGVAVGVVVLCSASCPCIHQLISDIRCTGSAISHFTHRVRIALCFCFCRLCFWTAVCIGVGRYLVRCPCSVMYLRSLMSICPAPTLFRSRSRGTCNDNDNNDDSAKHGVRIVTFALNTKRH